jgi:hypothetical protein
MQPDTRRRFIGTARAREVTHATRARIAATATIVQNKAGRAVSADRRVNYWTIIAAKLSASGLSWGCSSEIDATGRVLYTADAYRKDRKRFTVIADDRLTAFLELERVTRESLRFSNAE